MLQMQDKMSQNTTDQQKFECLSCLTVFYKIFENVMILKYTFFKNLSYISMSRKFGSKMVMQELQCIGACWQSDICSGQSLVNAVYSRLIFSFNKISQLSVSEASKCLTISTLTIERITSLSLGEKLWYLSRQNMPLLRQQPKNLFQCIIHIFFIF